MRRTKTDIPNLFVGGLEICGVSGPDAWEPSSEGLHSMWKLIPLVEDSKNSYSQLAVDYWRFFADMVGYGWADFLRKQRLNPLNVGTGEYQNSELRIVPCCTMKETRNIYIYVLIYIIIIYYIIHIFNIVCSQ